jgi:hypothetical protein
MLWNTGHVKENLLYSLRYIKWDLAGESCAPDVMKSLKTSPVFFLLRPPQRTQTHLLSNFWKLCS